MGKMTKTKLKKKKKLIPEPVLPEQVSTSYFLTAGDMDLIREREKEKIIFSFNFLDKNHEVINCSEAPTSWFVSLLEQLKQISKINRNEFIRQRQHYDLHGINWGDVDYCFNIPDNFMEQIGEDSCLQFRLSTSKGRIQGFMIGNRFYIVWLDPYHNLYPDQRFGGRKKHDIPLNCYEELLLKYKELKEEKSELEKLLEEMTKPDK